MPTLYNFVGIVMPFQPDWSDGVTERMEWMTDVVRARGSAEQRIIVRDTPRLSLDFNFLLKGNQAALLDNLMWRNAWRRFYTPYWPLASALDADALSGSSTISLDTTDRHFRQGGLLVLTDGEGSKVEPRYSEALNPSSISVSFPLSVTWPAGTIVIPAGEAVLQGGFETKSEYATANLMRSKMGFDFDPAANPILMSTGTVAATYRSVEILLAEPNWASKGSYDLKHYMKTVDFGTGPISVPDTDIVGENPYARQPVEMHTYEWFLKGRSAITSFRQFAMRRKGRAVSFWCPSWKSDFELLATVANGASAFTTKFNYAPQPIEGKQDIIIFFKNGSHYARRITGITDNEDWTQLVSVDTPFPFGFTVNDVFKICYLNWARLGSDTVEIQWEHPTFAKGKMTVAFIPET